MHTGESAAVVLTTAGMTLDDVFRVAVEGAPLEVTAEVYDRIHAARAVVDRAVEGETLVYGLNTGLGHLRDQRMPRETLFRYQLEMIRNHAAGVGPPLPDHDVRAMIVARVAGIARGGSGAHPGIVETLVAMLNRGVCPVVPAIGSVGAADLMHMAAVALVLIGEGEARLNGETLPGAEALARVAIIPHVPQPKDGLALINANGAAIGMGALAVREAGRVLVLANTAGALSLEATRANPGAYSAEAVAAKPFPGQIAAAEHLRALLTGSDLYEPATPRSIQDPLSFRVLPQVHGALIEAIDATHRAVEVELNAIDDNPLVSLEQDRLISNGNFHPMVLALSFEALRLGLAHTGLIAERRLSKEAELHFGADFLQEPDGYQPPLSGVLTYAAAAQVAELKHLANPVTLQCPPIDHDVEDHATLAVLAITLTRRAISILETIVLIEMLLATDVLQRLPAPPRLGDGTRAFLETVVQARRAAGEGATPATILETLREALASSPSWTRLT